MPVATCQGLQVTACRSRSPLLTDQCLGLTKSKEALSDCAYGQQVEVQGSKLDRYGRLIGKVLAHEQDCNLRQIRLGMAWHYKLYMKEQALEDRVLYTNEENLARNNKLGLWSDPSPVPPWDFRHH